MHKIIIVGGGFSGTCLAVNLLRGFSSGSLEIVLVESGTVGRGVAYKKQPYPRLLNVPAGRMSASSMYPDEFLTFARRSHPHASADDFLPRPLYGEYLESLLTSAGTAAPARVNVRRVCARAVRVEARYGAPTGVWLDDGGFVSGDVVVLALGNPAPAEIPALRSVRSDARYIADPWHTPVGFRPGENVLILGSGLTMADIVLAGMHEANGRATVQAISRRGLMPMAQSAFHPPSAGEDPAVLLCGSDSTRRMLRAVRTLANEVQLNGGDWREAVTSVRSVAGEPWGRLSAPERKRFLRHVLPYWDVHRHRLPQPTVSALESLHGEGRLFVRAGRVIAAESTSDDIRVHWRARGECDARVLSINRIINCTGPDYDIRRSTDPLLRSLQCQGLIAADDLGLGIRTSRYGA
ncbi:MAG: FAD/NAD(P)-binding protein, partial [Steroidobacteraceae bacterium]